jgi:hypothetical protein
MSQQSAATSEAGLKNVPCVIVRDWLHAYARKLFSSARDDKPIEFMTLIVGSISVGLLIWQLWDLNDTLESQAYSYIIAGLTEFDKTSVENSEYRKYFNQNTPISAAISESDRSKILSLADQKLDFIDSSYTQFDHINQHHYTKGAWDNYFAQSFRCSIVLRDLYCSETGLYGHKLEAFLAKTFPAGMCDGKKAKPYTPPADYCSD